MFEYIKGKVSEVIVDKIIIEVNGIGYRINSSINSTIHVRIGDEAIIYTFLAVKEDEINLYGFTSRKELNMFKLLLSVSKIGPKVATGILSTYDADRLASLIVKNDVTSISKSPGVGRKTAERLVLELKDKVEDYGMEATVEASYGYDDNIALKETTEALLSLGYTLVEAEKATKAVYNENFSSQDLIRKALGWLSK